MGSCERTVLERVGAWEDKAIRLGLTLDEDCLDVVLSTIDGFAACGTDWFTDCHVYVGERGLGEPCERVDDLGLMSVCSSDFSCRAGKCAERGRPIFELGEPCVLWVNGEPTFFGPGGGTCREPLRCDWTETTVCIETLATGSPCTRIEQCDFADYCRGLTLEAPLDEADPGVCTPRTAEVGETCEYVGECATTICIEGKCVEIPPPPPPTPALCDMVSVLGQPSMEESESD